MHAYRYDPTTREYLGTCPLVPNPRRPDAPCLQAFSTLKPALGDVPPGHTQIFAGEEVGWKVVEDHRDTQLWRKDDKSGFTLQELGPIPADCTTLEPGPWDEWDEAAQSWVPDLEAKRRSHAYAIRAERDRRLTASDRYALPDYPHEDEATRQAWLAYRQALREVPEQEGFPWTGPEDSAVPWPVEVGGG